MASHNAHTSLLLFGSEIYQLAPPPEQEEGGGGGGGDQGCASSMELPLHINGEGCTFYLSQTSSEKRKRHEDDRQHSSDASSDLKQCELQLFVGSLPTRKQQPEPVDISPVALNIRRFRHYTPMEVEEERQIGVSTRLQLCSDPWRIKKKLKRSDLGNLSRLLIPGKLVSDHLQPLMERAGLFDQVLTPAGLRVSVWDVETDSIHNMVLKRWISCGSFALIGCWCPDFVQRRRLKEGDEVGLSWDPYSSKFFFRVLNRAPDPIH